ncbi:MAG: helix-turn-helix domain-containing protein [Blastocatellia bacterium]|nr:helix-turn-helix domain-containing protein [Blastocatellia bacterium]
MPSPTLRLSGDKPDPLSLYPKELNTLGDWIRKTRLDWGITQEQAGVIFGVTECSVTNWELGHSEPEIRYYPMIIEFIGYYPYVPTSDLVERVKAVRIALGLSIEKLAEVLSVDKSSIASWERRQHRPGRKSRQLLLSFLQRQPMCVRGSGCRINKSTSEHLLSGDAAILR